MLEEKINNDAGKPRGLSNLHNKNSQTGPNDLLILFCLALL